MAELDAMSDGEAAAALRACCAVDAWVDAVAAGRPYADADALTAAGLTAFDALTPEQIHTAVTAHPAIGAKVDGGDVESRWSRGEQAAAAEAETDVKAAQAEANAAYTRRFGHVFLIRATGRTAAEILAETRRRLRNDPAAETVEVARELRQIVELRLRKLVSE